VKHCHILCVLPAIALLSFGQAKPEASSVPAAPVEQTLMQLERDWTQASLKKDIDALNRIMADDWVAIDFQGKTVTKAQTLANLKAGLPATQAAGLGEMKVRVFGDTAVVTGSDTEKSSSKGKDVVEKYLWTDVFVKRNGRWQAVASQSTRVAR
jgi:ketosteroid isomerase-like protein